MTYVNYDIDEWGLYSIRRENEDEKKTFVFVSKDKMERMNQLHRTFKGIENAPDKEEIEIVLGILDENKAITTSDITSTIRINKLVNEWVAIN